MHKTKKQVNHELLIMHEMFPSNQTELIRETPFQLLMSVILSAQTTDKQVNKVTAALYSHIKSPEDIISLGSDNLTQAISSIGFYKAKAAYIHKTAQLILQRFSSPTLLTSKQEKSYYQQYGYFIPQSVEVLITLSGVGIKTAKVVSHALYGGGEIGVDTHIHRVSNRLARVETKYPEQTGKLLEQLIYNKNKYIAHHSILLFGRYHCTARNPKCSICPLQQTCLYYQTIVGKTSTRATKGEGMG